MIFMLKNNSQSNKYLILFSLDNLDVISIEKTGENFRLLYDVKGRFTVHRITGEEAKVSCTITYAYPRIFNNLLWIRNTPFYK